jgi:dolichyl-phosphate-mannose--protein O-mannosyl transferase
MTRDKSGEAKDKQLTRHAYHIFLLTISYLASLTGILSSGIENRYLDEKYYLKCGILYIKGVCPLHCNPEHPPFAKYVYGLVFSLSPQTLRLFLVVLAIISVYLLYFITIQITNSENSGLLAAILITLDPLIINVWLFALLDNISLVLLLGGILLFNRSIKKYSKINLFLSSILISLSFY